MPGAETLSTTVISIFSTDPAQLELKLEVVGSAYLKSQRTREQMAADLQPFSWDLSSWFAASRPSPPTASVGRQLHAPRHPRPHRPLAGGRIHPVVSAAWVGTSQLRDGNDDIIGRYSYLTWHRGFELTLGARVRVFPTSEPVSPEIGFEPTFQVLQAGMEGGASGAEVGPLYEAQRLWGARITGGVVALLHDRGFVTGHIGASFVPVRGELTGRTLATSVFANVGYRRAFMFRRLGR